MALRALRRLLPLPALLLILGAPLQADARRPMTVEDFLAIERVGSPALSPDGRWVAFTVNRNSIEKNQGEIPRRSTVARRAAMPRASRRRC